MRINRSSSKGEAARKGKKTQQLKNSQPPRQQQTATFGQPTAVDMGPYDYTRSGNPTRAQLESQIAALEGVPRLESGESSSSSPSNGSPSFDGGALAFTSGMAALAAALRLAPAGTRVVAGDDLYGGTSRLLAQVAPACGVEVKNVDTSDAAAVEAALFDPSNPKPVSLLMLESPTNPRMQVADIRKLCALAKKANAISLVDNSILTPVFQSPLLLGAAISMTSATKFEERERKRKEREKIKHKRLTLPFYFFSPHSNKHHQSQVRCRPHGRDEGRQELEASTRSRRKRRRVEERERDSNGGHRSLAKAPPLLRPTCSLFSFFSLFSSFLGPAAGPRLARHRR